MCAKPFDKRRTALVEECLDTRRAHSSIVNLIFTASVSDAFQVDATIWFARSVIARNDRSSVTWRSGAYGQLD